MLDERKVKLMTKLALYEQTQGKEDLKVSEYYRKDYTSIHIIATVIWITIGYVAAIALATMAWMNLLLDKLSGGFIVTLGVAVVMGYFVVVIAYAIITNRVYVKKHKNARFRIKKYNHDLIVLLKMYEKEK